MKRNRMVVDKHERICKNNHKRLLYNHNNEKSILSIFPWKKSCELDSSGFLSEFKFFIRKVK